MRCTGDGLVEGWLRKRSVEDPQTGCWNWLLFRSDKGYAYAKHEGRNWRVARLVFVLIGEPLLPYPEEEARHTCDNPACVRPSHLVRGTSEQNIQDSLSRGRRFNQQITHCPQGHEYTESNTYWVKQYYKSKTYRTRKCRTCVLRKRQEYYASTR
jgi:hypothetical protein